MTGDLQTAILIEGLDDWVPLHTVDLISRRIDPALDQARRCEAIKSAVLDLIERGLVEAGTLTEKSGYVALRESTVHVLQRIDNAFLADDPNEWGYAIWLNNTQAGDAFARQAEAPADGS